METVVTVHLADVGLLGALRLLRTPPRPEETAGLAHADVAIAAPLRHSNLPALQPGRAALITFWDSRTAADDFDGTDPLGTGDRSGWHAVLEPVRAHGDWPGLPADVPRSRVTDYEGPSVVLTLARVRLPQVPRFLRTSRPAEQRALGAAGMVWGTALARPPFAATCSLWSSTDALSSYAYGAKGDPHPAAIAADRSKGFHHQSAFVRFRPVAVRGSLGGRNPLAPDAFPPPA